ncbi:winged helix-turn-helix domain-containing protein [Nanoarchaeota archaeon]
MAKKRCTRVDIYSQIFDILKQGKYNILQISKKTNINWQTVKNTLYTLENMGIVKKEDKKNKIYYSLKNPELNTNTLLGLPIKQEKETKQIAKRIIELWKEQTGENINKTFLQKILVKTIKKENLKIPYGWYLFGQCTVLKLDPNQIEEDSIKTYDETINATIKEYKDLPNTAELRSKHYKEENNVLYLDRLRIIEILSKPFDDESIRLLNQNLKDLVFTFHGEEDVIDLLETYYSLAVRIFKLENKEELRTLLSESFSALWDLLALDSLYYSLKDYYSEEILEYYYNQRKIPFKSTLDEYLSDLYDSIPKEIRAKQFQ